MNLTVGLFFFIVALAFFCEFIDSSLGMGYGTILTPVLLIMGFEPLAVVPAVLLSQALGGLAASGFHHQFKNVRYGLDSGHLKSVLIISGFGVLATIIGAAAAIKIPKMVLKTYIGSLVAVMGILVLFLRPYTFSFKKLMGIGILSAFNKGLIPYIPADRQHGG